MAYPSRKSDGGPDELKALREALAAEQPAPLYVFHGEESYLKEHYIARLKELLCGGLPELNCDVFDGKACTPDALRDAVLAYPAFGGRRLVIARDCDIMRATGGLADMARELFPAMPEECVLVFCYDTIEYKTPDKEMLQLVCRAGRVVDFKRAELPALEKWVISHFRALSKVCDRAEASYLIYLCGGLMNELWPEIQKIGHFCEGERITRADIDAVATPSVDARVFDLTDAVSAGQTAKALHVLQDLFALQEEPIAILAVLSNHMRQLYAASLLQKQGQGERELMKLAGVRHPFVAKKLLAAARSMDTDRIRTACVACAETDVALKSLVGDRRRMLELLLYRISGGEVC